MSFSNHKSKGSKIFNESPIDRSLFRFIWYRYRYRYRYININEVYNEKCDDNECNDDCINIIG